MSQQWFKLDYLWKKVLNPLNKGTYKYFQSIDLPKTEAAAATHRNALNLVCTKGNYYHCAQLINDQISKDKIITWFKYFSNWHEKTKQSCG